MAEPDWCCRLRLYFDAFGQSLEFIDCPDLAEGFKSILRGWRVRVAEDASDPPFISFRRANGRFIWSSDFFPTPPDWRQRPPRTTEQAVYLFHYYFFDWFVARHPDLFCLHAAAIEFPDGVAVFPSIQRAGKSTLTTELARRGLTVFCDDVLPVEVKSRQAMALGILPRLRLPLPENASADYRAFVAERRALSSHRWAYLAMKESELAPFGRRQSICAIVSLDRASRRRPAELSTLPISAAVALTIDRNFAKHFPPTIIFEDFFELASTVHCLKLSYSDVEDAAEVLVRDVGGNPESVRYRE